MPIGTSDTASKWNINKPRIIRNTQINKDQSSNILWKIITYIGIEVLAAALAELTAGFSEVIANSFELSEGTVEAISIFTEIATDFTVHEIDDVVNDDADGFNTLLNAFSSLGGLSKFNINKLEHLSKLNKLSAKEIKVLSQIKKQIMLDKKLFSLFKNSMTLYSLLNLFSEDYKDKARIENLTFINNLLNNLPSSNIKSTAQTNSLLNSYNPNLINRTKNQPLWKIALKQQIFTKWNVKYNLLKIKKLNLLMNNKIVKHTASLKTFGFKPLLVKDSYYQVIKINQIFGCLVIYQTNKIKTWIDTYSNLDYLVKSILLNFISKKQTHNPNININNKYLNKLPPRITAQQEIVNRYTKQTNIKIYQPMTQLRKELTNNDFPIMN